MGVGVGIDEAAAVATNTIPMEASLPPGSSLTDALSTNASGVISGVAHGVTEQTHEMGQAILNIDNGIPAAQDLARETIWAPAASTQDAIGFHAGMVIMQAVEKGFASLTSNLLATWTMEALTGDVSRTKPPVFRDTRTTRKTGPATSKTHMSKCWRPERKFILSYLLWMGILCWLFGVFMLFLY
ncbi:hypothetical protein FOZG_10234 [Fusarium oxysporum Fo47]|uniref:Uncharacterized protein n=1 Tax=Fusarium oxysporum Fo47 TaxID=660027 RepID=W9KBC2_FUSOX|nr:hypothetical protein FOZG_10234 [Fusarium oxysporum Fo47]